MGVGVKNNMFDNIIGIVHKRKPLIHSITNYVSMNDCANILLACGGAAIMAEDTLEVRQITAICDGLNLNIGMLNENSLRRCWLLAEVQQLFIIRLYLIR